MKPSELKHGDVLLYIYKKKASILVKFIRLICGNKYVHASVVCEIDKRNYILEQSFERIHSYIPAYTVFEEEEIHCYRPKFIIPSYVIGNFKRKPYGYLGIIDCAINHLLRRVTFGHWEYKPMLSRLFNTKNIVCSALVAQTLRLKEAVEWCKYLEVVEPDDYSNHTENFTFIGILDWE